MTIKEMPFDDFENLLETIKMLIEVCHHGDFRNGVTDPTGSIDEGEVRTGELIDDARRVLRKHGVYVL